MTRHARRPPPPGRPPCRSRPPATPARASLSVPGRWLRVPAGATPSPSATPAKRRAPSHRPRARGNPMPHQHLTSTGTFLMNVGRCPPKLAQLPPAGYLSGKSRLMLIERRPISTWRLERGASVIATDSGASIRAFFYRMPCVTLRRGGVDESVELGRNRWRRHAAEHQFSRRSAGRAGWSALWRRTVCSPHRRGTATGAEGARLAAVPGARRMNLVYRDRRATAVRTGRAAAPYGMLTQALAAGYDVTWWTSFFPCGQAARVRVIVKSPMKGSHSSAAWPGYRRNVSLARIRHQQHFAGRFSRGGEKLARPRHLSDSDAGNGRAGTALHEDARHRDAHGHSR